MSKVSNIQNAELPHIETANNEEFTKLFNDKISHLESRDPEGYKRFIEALQSGRKQEAKALIRDEIINDPQMLALVDMVHVHEINCESET